MRKLLFLLALIFMGTVYADAQTNIFPATGSAGIGTVAPNAKAALEVVSTTQGVLLPRMTTAQRNAIATPPLGLLIYQTDGTKGLYQYNGSGWAAVTSASANKTLANLTAPTAVNQSLLPGTTNTIDLGSATKTWKNGFFSGNIGIGTTAPQAMLDVNGDAKINGVFVGRGNGGVTTNTIVGNGALNANTTGEATTANGYQALYSNTTGFSNTANGYQALYSNTTGEQNTANGVASLFLNNTGVQNTANGTAALYSNTTGYKNTANGFYALFSNTTGIGNTAIGYSADVASGALTNATAIGANALVSASNSLVLGNGANVGIGTSAPAVKLDVVGNIKITDGTQGAGKVLTSDATGLATWASLPASAASWNLTGNGGTAVTNFLGTTDNRSFRIRTNNTQRVIIDSTGNVGIGTSAPSALLDINGDALINGITVGKGGSNIISNTATGSRALYSNSTGTSNTANGNRALYSNSTGYNNTANGYQTLYKNTTGYYNTANGNAALYFNTTGNLNTANGNAALYFNTTGSSNTANGNNALYSNTTGSTNTANGDQALYYNTTGFDNTANGYQTLFFNTTGYRNSVNGAQTLYSNTTGYSNTANGYQALFSNTTGSSNTANGDYALGDNTTGYNNTANGLWALSNNSTGYNNTALGFMADVTSGALTNATAIGANALVSASNSLVLGSNANVGIGTSTPGSQFHINNDLSALNDPSASILLTRLWNSPTDARGSSIFHYYSTSTSKDNLAFAVSGDGSGNYLSPLALNQIRMLIGADGKVGIGTTAPTAKLSINGNANNTTGAWGVFSDSRIKKVNAEFTDGLNVIKQIRTIKFNYNKNAPFNAEGEQIGVVAQELEKIAPYMVSKVSMGDIKDLREVNNQAYPFLLINAVKELAAANDVKDAVIAELKSQNAEMKNDIAAIKAMLTKQAGKPIANINQQEVSFANASLDQNTPNPPAGNFTRINYNIPNGAAKAELVIVDNAGRKIKQISLSTFGKGTLNVDTKGLASGTYTYTMYVDGKMIDSKKMVVGK